MDISKLKTGDIVRSIGGNGDGYIVTASYGRRATAVRTVDITNPDEWELAVHSGRAVQRFHDGKEKPWISAASYDELRDDDKFLYNRLDPGQRTESGWDGGA